MTRVPTEREWVGVAMDERVRVVVSGGRIAELALDARALRAGNVELAEAVMGAVNAALDSAAAELTKDLPTVEDARARLAEIREVHADRMRAASAAAKQNLDQVAAFSALHLGRHYG